MLASVMLSCLHSAEQNSLSERWRLPQNIHWLTLGGGRTELVYHGYALSCAWNLVGGEEKLYGFGLREGLCLVISCSSVLP